MLSVNAISKTFGGHRAVVDLSFQAEEGKIYGLIGPNGAGKTTTIRMILGILAADSGSIRLSGAKLGPADRSRIGYLPEERGLYKKQKLVDMLLYLAALRGCPRAVAMKRLDYWLERFDLSEWKDRRIDALSKGMSQKVQFIAAVLHEPELLILDEPFSGLDPVSADELLAVIRELRGQGKLVLFSTHVMEQAEKICDHIIMLRSGHKLLDDSLSAVRAARGNGIVSLSLFQDLSDSRLLLSLPGVQFVTGTGRDFLLKLKQTAEPSVLFSALAALNLPVRSFSVQEPSLHDIFVSLAEDKGEQQ